MQHTFRNDRPLPYHREEQATEDERLDLGLEKNRRKFSMYDLLARIANHATGKPVNFRNEDKPLIKPIVETGLISNMSEGEEKTHTRTDLAITPSDLKNLTFKLEDKIKSIRDRLSVSVG